MSLQKENTGHLLMNSHLSTGLSDVIFNLSPNYQTVL